MKLSLREIVKETLENLICLKTPVIYMEDIYEFACDHIRQMYHYDHKEDPNEELMKSIFLEEFDILLYDIRIVGFWHFHKLLNTARLATNFNELKDFLTTLKHEKVLEYVLDKAIEREDLEIIKLLAHRVDINIVQLVSAMKNKEVFELLYGFNNTNKNNLLAISCFLQNTEIQDLLLDDGAQLNEKSMKDIENKKYQYVFQYEQAKINKDKLLEKVRDL